MIHTYIYSTSTLKFVVHYTFVDYYDTWGGYLFIYLFILLSILFFSFALVSSFAVI